jgi:predicted O-methyltransferase YrrM
VVTQFKPYPNVHVVRGSVPATLPSVRTGPVAFLHIDLNSAAPERAAFEHFWPKMARGGIVVFDDYNWVFFKRQKETIDDHARAIGRQVLCLPTGQGLLVNN